MDVMQEERRLFYVAMTRAKNHLYALKVKGKPSSFVDEILPPPDPPKPKGIERPRYSIDQFQKEIEQRQRKQEEAKRKAAEAVQAALKKAAADRYNQGYKQVKDYCFQSDERVEDSFGVRWLQCERCEAIKPKDDFALVGRLHRPSIGVCSDCARKG